MAPTKKLIITSHYLNTNLTRNNNTAQLNKQNLPWQMHNELVLPSLHFANVQTSVLQNIYNNAKPQLSTAQNKYHE